MCCILYLCVLLIHRCPECAKLEREFVKAAGVLKDHEPPVIFAKVQTSTSCYVIHLLRYFQRHLEICTVIRFVV